MNSAYHARDSGLISTYILKNTETSRLLLKYQREKYYSNNTGWNIKISTKVSLVWKNSLFYKYHRRLSVNPTLTISDILTSTRSKENFISESSHVQQNSSTIGRTSKITWERWVPYIFGRHAYIPYAYATSLFFTQCSNTKMETNSFVSSQCSVSFIIKFFEPNVMLILYVWFESLIISANRIPLVHALCYVCHHPLTENEKFLCINEMFWQANEYISDKIFFINIRIWFTYVQ